MDKISFNDPFQVEGGMSMVFIHERQIKPHALSYKIFYLFVNQNCKKNQELPML
jgi:hypothetical protein